MNNEQQKIDVAMNWWYDISDQQTIDIIIKHNLIKPIREQDIVKMYDLYYIDYES